MAQYSFLSLLQSPLWAQLYLWLLRYAESLIMGLKLAMTMSQAERCAAELKSLTSELEAAQPSLRSAAQAEDAAATACARSTPALLQHSAALKQDLAQSLPAADSLKAQLPHLHMVAADLKLMSVQVITV